MDIKWIGSPNFDTKRTPIDEVFVHWIVGTLASADTQFQKKTPGTSAHYGIEDDVIHQYVKEENVAYHAGVYSHNQRSIGIEHSASPDRAASDKTYETSGRLIAEICKRHNIPLDRTHIRGHKEVRSTQCPGTMDIDRLINIAKTHMGNDTDSQKVIDQLRLERDNNWNLYQAQTQETQKRQERIEELEGERDQLIKDKEKLTEDLKKEQVNSQTYLEQLTKITDEEKNTTEQLIEAQKALQPAQDALNRIVVALGGSYGATPEEVVQLVFTLQKSKIKQAAKPVTFLEKLKFLFG